MPLFLILCASCSGRQHTKVVTVPQVIRVTTPRYLLAPTPEPKCDIEVNEDLVRCIQSWKDTCRKCNADKAAALKFQDGAIKK